MQLSVWERSDAPVVFGASVQPLTGEPSLRMDHSMLLMPAGVTSVESVAVMAAVKVEATPSAVTSSMVAGAYVSAVMSAGGFSR